MVAFISSVVALNCSAPMDTCLTDSLTISIFADISSVVADNSSLVALISVALSDISLINVFKFVIALFRAFAKIPISSLVSILTVFDKSFSESALATTKTFFICFEIEIDIIKPSVIAIK